MTNRWPDGLVDARVLFEFVAECMGFTPEQIKDGRGFNRVFYMEKRIEEARRVGLVTRLVGRDPTTGEVFGYAYRRDEIKAFVAKPASL